jgi:hypothetical protein
MKNFKIIAILVIILSASATTFLYSESSTGNIDKPQPNESIIFVRAYEHGWIKSVRGIYICYGNGKIEKIELVDDIDPITNADKVATTLNQVAAKGYKFIGAYRQSGAGIHSENYFAEYIFKK